jgi:hypothetical protein
MGNCHDRSDLELMFLPACRPPSAICPFSEFAAGSTDYSLLLGTPI